jgi:hypothetical protein
VATCVFRTRYSLSLFSSMTLGSPVSLVMGPDGVKGRITDYRAAFPDLKIEVEDVVP